MVLSDAQIESLVNEPKRWAGREKISLRIADGHKRAEKTLYTESGNIFKVFIRQLVEDPLDFTIGLLYKDKVSGEEIVLVRCNGPSHVHPNRIEKNRLEYVCHIHKATQRYMESGFKPEKWAYETTNYDDIESGLEHLSEISNISPKPYIKEPPSTLPLFEDEK